MARKLFVHFKDCCIGTNGYHVFYYLSYEEYHYLTN
jgi:hypothetical protein